MDLLELQYKEHHIQVALNYGDCVQRCWCNHFVYIPVSLSFEHIVSYACVFQPSSMFRLCRRQSDHIKSQVCETKIVCNAKNHFYYIYLHHPIGVGVIEFLQNNLTKIFMFINFKFTLWSEPNFIVCIKTCCVHFLLNSFKQLVDYWTLHLLKFATLYLNYTLLDIISVEWLR